MCVTVATLPAPEPAPAAWPEKQRGNVPRVAQVAAGEPAQKAQKAQKAQTIKLMGDSVLLKENGR